ncbi:MAG TPA: OmpA family protein [Thermoanaerobaculia bacterium]|nr:OmpA family protein [Thermoanaerobaculia bacterium]
MKRAFAVLTLTLFLGACISADDPNRRTKQGAATGAAVGAAAGAVIGNQSDERTTGAVVGGVVGAAVGAAVGRRMDQQQRELQQIEGVDVTRTAEDELNVVLRNDVLFDVDRSALRPESRTALREMASVFSRYDDTIILIEGHTDSTGTAAYNQRLSEQRAASVRTFLLDQGVSSSRMIARGFGLTQPRASNATAEGRQLNRRVEINVRATQTQG